jgi:hypothetical protein
MQHNLSSVLTTDPLLDYNSTKRQSIEWSKKQRRAYSRMLNGFKMHKGERLRFLTLTTPKKPKKNLSDAWNTLKKRVERLTVKKLIDDGYIKRSEWRRYYDSFNVDFRMAYLCVWTSEGANGVLHILYFGQYLPQQWLSDQWNDIIGAKIVDVRACKKDVYNAKRLARYCVAQYCANQPAYIQFSSSHNWCFKGYLGLFRHFVSEKGFEWAKWAFDRLIAGYRVRLYDEIFEIDLYAYKRIRICQTDVSGGWAGLLS